ncbi:hypothetical protein ACCQ08_24650 [Comamonas sp. SY3]|uniref:hypothetical protein n=1 Tax=Comamonas sp. SY3 TaxID=3243601 RepID=UPI003594722A
MNELPEWVKWLGAIGGTIAGGVLFLRQYLSGAAAERANDSGQIAAINVWRQVAEAAQAQATAERGRADQFAKERNEAIELVGTLKGQLAEMNRQLAVLQTKVDQLTEQLNAKNKI